MAALHAMTPEPEPTPEPLDIDLNELTIDDLDAFEEITGLQWEDAEKGGFRSIKALRALIYIVKHKADPSFTIEDAGKTKLSTFQLRAETDPTDAAGSSS